MDVSPYLEPLSDQGRIGELVKQVYAAIDSLGHIMDIHGLLGLMTDTPGSPQEDHGRRDLFRHNHGIMPGSADHALGHATGLAHCVLNFIDKKGIQEHGLLVKQDRAGER